MIYNLLAGSSVRSWGDFCGYFRVALGEFADFQMDPT